MQIKLRFNVSMIGENKKECVKQKQDTPYEVSCYGGRWRIRTAVDGFADRCLATRPTDHFACAKIQNYFINQILFASILKVF